MAEANVYHQLVDIHAEKPTREVARIEQHSPSADRRYANNRLFQWIAAFGLLL
jgi:hypothetical protein